MILNIGFNVYFVLGSSIESLMLFQTDNVLNISSTVPYS